MPPRAEYLNLSGRFALKRLETPCLYDLEGDDLFELSPDAFDFLSRRATGAPVTPGEPDDEFLATCLAEGILSPSEKPVRSITPVDPSPNPSLRYLELQITDRCNLRCRHCYLGEGGHNDLPLDLALAAMGEFEKMQGLRLLLSGGEPLLYPRFWELNEVFRRFAFRTVLLSNGTLIDRDAARRLRAHEVQVSLDGLGGGHDTLRGRGTFDLALGAVDSLLEAGITVSVATMIHRANLGELHGLAELLKSRGIAEWNVDVPCLEGRLRDNLHLQVSPSEAAPFLTLGFGGGFHGAGDGMACGAHLSAVLPDGRVARCGLLAEQTTGGIPDGLKDCWERLPRVKLEELSCRCSEIEDCRGGCRYRAMVQGDAWGPDFYQCHARGVTKGGEPA